MSYPAPRQLRIPSQSSGSGRHSDEPRLGSQQLASPSRLMQASSRVSPIHMTARRSPNVKALAEAAALSTMSPSSSAAVAHREKMIRIMDDMKHRSVAAAAAAAAADSLLSPRASSSALSSSPATSSSSELSDPPPDLLSDKDYDDEEGDADTDMDMEVPRSQPARRAAAGRGRDVKSTGAGTGLSTGAGQSAGPAAGSRPEARPRDGGAPEFRFNLTPAAAQAQVHTQSQVQTQDQAQARARAHAQAQAQSQAQSQAQQAHAHAQAQAHAQAHAHAQAQAHAHAQAQAHARAYAHARAEAYGKAQAAAARATAAAAAAAAAEQPLKSPVGHVGWTMADLACHLALRDGVLHPALDQRPGRFAWEELFSILGAKLPAYDSRLDRVALRLHGQVLCHLMNLYALTFDCHHRDYETGALREGSCETSIGEFRWDHQPYQQPHQNTGSRMRVTFFPPARRTRGPVMPFRGLRIAGGPRRVEAYLSTLVMGVSDPAFEWPRFPDHPRVWIRKLGSNLERLQSHRPEWGALLVTPTWLETAKYVRRMILFNGYRDCRLLDSIRNELEVRDKMLARVAGLPDPSHLPPDKRRGGRAGSLLLSLFDDCLDQSRQYRIVPRHGTAAAPSSRRGAGTDPETGPGAGSRTGPASLLTFDYRARTEARGMLLTILSWYRQERPGTWLYTLCEERERVCDLLFAGTDILVDPSAVVALPFDMCSGLWDKDEIILETGIRIGA